LLGILALVVVRSAGWPLRVSDAQMLYRGHLPRAAIAIAAADAHLHVRRSDPERRA